jgi:signal transduction histidine kinase
LDLAPAAGQREIAHGISRFFEPIRPPMSYRGIKRVLGETNLERKCRFLFGLCLALLIAIAFVWVSTITEKLAMDTARTRARRLVDAYMLECHFVGWESEPARKELVKEVVEDVQLQKYRAEFLTLDDSASAVGITRAEDPLGYIPQEWVSAPSDEEERAILKELREKLRQQQDELAEQASEERGTAASAQPAQTLEQFKRKDFEPVFADRRVVRDDNPDHGEYHYYQPVYWGTRCIECHRELSGAHAFPAADQGAVLNEDTMFRVVKVTIDDKKIRSAIAWTRAILITAGIVTVFLSMVGLYMIVRYVIVKPLKHLRDVSDEISRGNTDLRAEIQTNDEFEDLAVSFNRMLRHLTETQAELQNVNEDLDAKVDQLAQMNMQLYEMNRMKSDFLASVSHELRTPLNSIIGFSEVLNALEVLDDKQKRYVKNIQKSGRVLLDMINDILDLAKMESGKMEVRPSEFDLQTVVTAQCDIVRSLTDEKNIDLECEVPEGGDLPLMYQDQSKVQQLLTNLLSNAIKFTPEGGRITVSARREADGMMAMTVADTGVGIAEEDREIIFEKFRQSTPAAGNDSLTREYSGTGLGLSIVKELCILLGGKVGFVSELGKGSAFTVHLPWQLRDATAAASAGYVSRIDSVSPAKPVSMMAEVRGDTGAPVQPSTVTEEAASSG